MTLTSPRKRRGIILERKNMMYGDLVGFCMMLICSFLFIRPAFQELPIGDPRLPGAYAVIATYVWNIGFSFCSWWTSKTHFSLLAAVGYIAQMVFQNLFQFPPMGGMAIIPHFLWLLLVFSCNVSLKLLYKIILGLLSLTALASTAFHSPGLSSQEEYEEVISTFVGSTIVYIVFHFCWAVGDAEILAQSSLAVSFVYSISWEIITIRQDPEYAPEGGVVIVKTTCLATVGLFALGVFRTEKKTSSRLKAQVEEQEDKLHMVGLAVKASDTAVAITTSFRDIIWFNPAFERLCDIQGRPSQSEGETLKFEELSSGKFVELFDKNFKKEAEILVGERVLQVEVSPFRSNIRGKLGSGSQHDSSEIRFLVVLKDNTADYARAKAEKTAQQEALLTKAMSESMETLTHELRTPLVGVRGITSILVHEEGLPGDMKESLNLIMASSGLLLVLINNLLDIRKLHANMMEEFPLEPISLTGPVDDAVGFCRPLAAISGVNIDVVADQRDRDVLVLSNDLRLQQVIINLISNAIKYTPSEGTIRISYATKTVREVEQCMDRALATGGRKVDDEAMKNKDGKVLVLSVADPGAGIAPGQEQRLFRKFAMLNSKQKGSLGQNMVGQPTGSGLGLNLCLKFVHLMNGNIWVMNNPDRGSTFSFYLPAKESTGASNTPDAVTKKPKPTLRKSHSFEKHRVLLVDDTLINRKVFARMLQRIGISQTRAVESGPAALDALEKEDYDLVISDIQMPGMSGMELCEAIQSSTSLQNRPVVVGLTADTSQRVEEECVKSGMADVLHKPLTVDEMYLYFETVVPQFLNLGDDNGTTNAAGA